MHKALITETFGEPSCYCQFSSLFIFEISCCSLLKNPYEYSCRSVGMQLFETHQTVWPLENEAVIQAECREECQKQ